MVEFTATGSKKLWATTVVHIPDHVNVKAIRQKLHMTRESFAACFGFKVRTLEKWEQGVRNPEGSTRAYLIVIKNNPKAVQKALLAAK